MRGSYVGELVILKKLWAPNDKRWLLFGIPFTLFVAGLIIYLNVGGKEVVPHIQLEGLNGDTVEAHWNGDKEMFVCGAPDYVYGLSDRAVAFLRPHGIRYSSVTKTEGPCSSIKGMRTCEYEDKEKGLRLLPCMDGAIVMTMADGKFNFGGIDGGGHGDETFLSTNLETGEISHVTAIFPDDFESIRSMEIDGKGLFTDDDFPVEVEFFTVVHAQVHAEGRDHVRTSLGFNGWIYAEPTGHVMSSSMKKLGPNTKGL